LGTTRSPERLTLGPAVGKVARRLGKPFMPWQQYVADVILEIDSDTGRLAYQEYGLTVPRQSGKSTFVLAKSTHRCSATGFFGSRNHVVYTAQTRAKAREKWEEDFVADLEASIFKTRMAVHKGNGQEHIRFKNGSRFGIDANTEKAGHGGTLDEAYIDEAFAQVDFRLEQAFGPAMITRANKQLGWISTAGWLNASPYLAAKMKTGRVAVDDDRRSGLAYFEWSASEDDDPGDPATWWSCMPALGWTISEADIRLEYEKARDADKLNDFKRAYLNLWVPKEAEESEKLRAAWSKCSDAASVATGRPVFAVDVSPKSESAVVVSVTRRDDAVAHLELVDYRPGTDWVVALCAELDRRHDPDAWMADPGSPIGALLPDLADRGIAPIPITGRAMGYACESFVSTVTDRGVRHLGDPAFDRAIAGSVPRDIGDGLWTWSRRKSADICPLVAATLALWGFTAYGGEGLAPGDVYIGGI